MKAKKIYELHRAVVDDNVSKGQEQSFPFLKK